MDVLDRAPDPSGILLAWIPCPDAATALAIGRRLVEDRIAACANILPGATSIYRWEGEIRTDGEAILVAKTTRANAARMTETVKELHPYELPAISTLALQGGSEEFLRWIGRETA